MGLHQFVVGCHVLICKKKYKLAKMAYLSPGISAAIKCCVEPDLISIKLWLFQGLVHKTLTKGTARSKNNKQSRDKSGSQVIKMLHSTLFRSIESK